jgi:hypothetical protein
MEALFYQTQDLDLPAIAQALVLEYQGKGYEAQQFGDRNNVTVQLKEESTLRTITGFNKALAISLQRIQSGTFVGVGAQDLSSIGFLEHLGSSSRPCSRPTFLLSFAFALTELGRAGQFPGSRDGLRPPLG